MRKSREYLDEIASGFLPARVLLTAVELDVFTVIEPAPVSADAVARHIRCDPESTRRLLDALVALKLLVKRGGAYRNTPSARRHLVEGAPEYQGDIMRHRANMWESWSRLTQVVRTGKARCRGAKQEERSFIRGMADVARDSAVPTARALERELRASRRVLDVGGGPAVYACEFARLHPELRVTVLDLPGPLEIARETIRAYGLSRRVKTRAGDALRLGSYGRGYDLVLLSNFVHCFRPRHARQVLDKAVRAVRPGGLVVVKDFYIHEDRTSPPFAALFSMNMLTAAAGDCYTRGEIEAWLEPRGVRPIRFAPVAKHSHVLVGRKG